MNPTGLLEMEAGGKTYRLHLGMSVLAKVQAKHGKGFDDLLAGGDGLPNLAVIHDLFLGALERYHPEADKYVVDDLIAENISAVGDLMAASFPSAEGKAKRRKA